MAEVDSVFGSDTGEDIQRCLNCEFAECNNCLALKNKVEDVYAYAKTHMRRIHKIDQYTLDGEFIRTWERRGDAAEALGISPQYISYCCNGSRGPAGGYIWRYHEEEKNV